MGRQLVCPGALLVRKRKNQDSLAPQSTSTFDPTCDSANPSGLPRHGAGLDSDMRGQHKV